MVFPGKGEPFVCDWYLIEYDKLFKIIKKLHGHAAKWFYPNRHTLGFGFESSNLVRTHIDYSELFEWDPKISPRMPCKPFDQYQGR